jgi:hypothetical protein
MIGLTRGGRDILEKEGKEIKIQKGSRDVIK